MIRSTLTPANMTPVRLWAGVYGGHYEVIVFFREKPTHRMDKNNDTKANGKFVDVYEESVAGNVFADLAFGTFEAWFPGDWPLPTATEVVYRELFEVELTIPLDEDGEWEGLDVHVDWP